MAPLLEHDESNGHQHIPQTPKNHGNDPPLSACPEPIAICGMACRWPGGASNSSKLWDLLAEKRSGFGEFKDNKLNIDGFYHPNQHRPGSMFTKGGYFLSEDPKEFDHTFFGVTPVETMTMDPAQRKLLECTFEALENAGETWESVSGSRTGVFVGNFNYDHQLMQIRDADHPLPYVTTGGGITILSNRINYVFNLKGPSLTIDTACSSSMYALHLAVTSIRSGECDAAVVGGSNLILGPEAQLFSTKLGAISPTSTCHTFDAAADGYARADGFGCLYLKKVSAAVADGDPIRAVIRGTAINANGRTGGISHPSPEGQEAVMRRAYESAGGLDPSLTGYFECHGTGTPVGDPLEVDAIGRLFASGRQESPLLIGSIKTNLGHSESSSGIAGIMKAVLAIERGIIPPTIGLVNPNPKIDFDGAKVKVVTELTLWPSKPIRRASVNSFGYGGANAHCILEHVSSIVPGYKLQGVSKSLKYASKFSNGTTKNHSNEHAKSANGNGAIKSVGSDTDVERLTEPPHFLEKPNAGTRRLVLLPVSGHDEVALKSNISMLSGIVEGYDLADVAYTLASRRSRFFQRSFAIADGKNPAASLDAKAITSGKSQAQIPKIGFVFTGQGAQWSRMGSELYEEYFVFRQSIDYQDSVLAKLSHRPYWTIKSILLESAEKSRVQEPEISQPICTALQIALFDLLKSWNVTPVVAVGHSSGEIAAAYAAGFHTAAEAITMAYFRGQAVAANAKTGSMLAVGLGEEQVAPYIAGNENYVKIAAHNSPESVTLSGKTEAIENINAKLKSDNIFARILKTGGNAYHSHHMVALGASYEAMASQGLKEIKDDIAAENPSLTKTMWISSVTSQVVTKMKLSPSYWRANLESPVLFSQALQAMAKQTEVQVDLLVEVGPHPALSGPINQIRGFLQESQDLKLAPCLGSLVRGEDALRSILVLAGNLFIKNATVDIKSINAMDVVNEKQHQLAHGSIAIDMPNSSYHYGPVLYYENRYNEEWRLRKHLRHDLLGAKQPGCAKNRPSWRNMLRLKDVPWLDDHKLLPHPVFPAAGYLAMAIEAITQFHYEKEGAGNITGYSLRSVAVNSTLEVPDDEFGIETILNLQPSDLTIKSFSSKWHEFRICSVIPGSKNWTEHVLGHICVETEKVEADEVFEIDSRARLIDINRWYAKFREVGLGYGQTFQGLSDLRACRSDKRATALVDLKPTTDIVKGGESKYPIHPATIDTCLQLALIACHAGQVENVKYAFVPIVVNEMSIRVPAPEEDTDQTTGKGMASGEIRGLRGAYAKAQLFNQSGFMLMNMKQIQCVAYDGGNGAETTQLIREPYLKLEWKPDVTTLTDESARKLFPPVKSAQDVGPIFNKFDRLSAFVLVQFHEAESQLFKESHSEHLAMFLAWVERCIASAKNGTLKYGQEAISASSATRVSVIEQLSAELDDIVEAKLIRRIYDALPKIFSNETSGLHVALQDNLLTELYISGIGISAVYPQLLRLLDLLAHKNPRMNIIEVGAGTGGATRLVLRELAGRSNFKRYGTYTFTDVTPSFLSAAQEEFAECKNLSYKILDIETDPTSQGYDGSYDLVLASQVLHATTTISETIQHARRLLKTGGKMILVEITRVHIGTGLVLGTFADYWSGVHEGRIDSPLMTKAQWHKALLENGFSGLDIALDDYGEGNSMASVLLTTAVEPKFYPTRSLNDEIIYLCYRSSPTSFAQTVQAMLQAEGHNTVHASLVDDSRIPERSRIISFIDLENAEDSLLSTCDAEELRGLKSLVSKAKSLLWVSSGSLVQGLGPKSAIMIGLLRAITTEMPSVRFASVDLERGSDFSDQSLASTILAKEAGLQVEQLSAIDGEYVMNEGILNVSRLFPNDAANSRFRRQIEVEKTLETSSMDSQGPLTVNYDQAGLLSSLYFKSDESFSEPIQDGWIDVETKAIGLNIKDMAVATGRFDWNKFSTECAGVVSKVGPGVKDIQVGDRVYGPAPGNFGNYVRCLAISMQKMRPTDKFHEVATLPVAYMTAVYAFMHLAHLSKGESVLIQSATGGLGMAALRIAKYLGAEIYATVGTPDKVQVLVNKFGIHPDHIFNSRELKASKDIMKATENRGIDVVLCSAAGEMMHETWKCIAPMGRFIEVGRTDVLGHGKLSLEVFLRNATFSSFDLGLLNQQKPEFVARLMKHVGELYRQDIIKPIDYIKTFDISQLEEAMMYFAKGIHLGKVVVTFENPSAMVKLRPTVQRPSFDSNATYLLVGCLGGLGRSISIWMVERGAKHLTYISRSGASNSEARSLIEELAKFGVTTEVVKCDVIRRAELKTAVKKINDGRKIKGVIHAAMVEGDSTFANMELKQLKSVLAPKVDGSINLHYATLDCDLDFFTMTSSIVTMIGTATQGAYCAANAFQDSFARYRKQQGLPAKAIALGLILEVGFVSQLPEVQKALMRNGVYGTSEYEFLELFEASFLGQKDSQSSSYDPLASSHLLMGLEPSKLIEMYENGMAADFTWHTDARFSNLLQAIQDQSQTQASTSTGGSVMDKLKNASTAEMHTLVTEAIVERLAKLLFIATDEIEPSQAVSDYGMDSMIAAELRNWLVKNFQTDISFLELLNPKTKITVLADLVLRTWK